MFSQIESKYEGNLYIYAKELGSGKIWAYREDEFVATASTIKLPILVHTALCVEEGKLQWDTPITLNEDQKVAGMGVLRHLNVPRQLTLHDACYLMTAISDNTATNLVIDATGVDSVNERIKAFGMHHTRLYRKVFFPDTEESRVYGLGVTTPKDMALLMMKLYRPNLLSENVTQKVKQLLSLQTDLVGIASVLPPDWFYAGKTGRVTAVRGDVAYVRAPDGREWILSMFCYGLTTANWSIRNEGLLSIAESTEFILGLNQD